MGRAFDHGELVYPQGYISGLTLSTAGASTTFAVATGEATDSTFSAVMNLGSSLSKTTSAWAVGSGNGALDTGAIAASTWYHVFLIKRLDTGVVDVLVSLSPTAPTMPTSYTVFRRIGSMKTDGSSKWTLFHQFGSTFLWDVRVQDINQTNPGVAAVLSTLTVPTGIQVDAIIDAYAYCGAGSSGFYLYTSPDESDQTPSAAANTFNGAGSSLAGGSGRLTIRTNTSAQIRTRCSASVASTFVAANTVGWIDLRGGSYPSSDAYFMDPASMRGYLAGLVLSTAGSSATFTVAAGSCVDSTNAAWMKLTGALSKTTSAWAVGNAAGGLDTGAIAINTWYHAYLIKRQDTGVVDVLVSLSATAPTMPSGYTWFRRLGAMKTNASSQWTSFHQNGDEFLWDSTIIDASSVTLPTASRTLYATSVPTGVQVWWKGLIYVINSTTAATYAYAITSPDQLDYAPTAGTSFDLISVSTASFNGYGEYVGDVRTNTSAQFGVRASAASCTMIVETRGWIDRRGRDS